MISTHAIAPRVYPYLVVLPFLLTGLLPDTLNPGVVTVAGLLLGGALCMLALMTALRPLSRGAALAAGSLIGSAVWFALAATWATNPTISLVGLVGLHNGAALWALGAVWVAAGLLWANARSLRETLLGVALSGAFFSVALMYEVLKDGGQRAQGYPAGLFENSNSAGELFAVASLTPCTLRSGIHASAQR
jgi:hypothetical protein